MSTVLIVKTYGEISLHLIFLQPKSSVLEITKGKKKYNVIGPFRAFWLEFVLLASLKNKYTTQCPVESRFSVIIC